VVVIGAFPSAARGQPQVRKGPWSDTAQPSGLPASRSSPLPRASPSALRAGPYDDVRRRSSPRARGYATGADWAPWSLRTGDEGLNPFTTR
jgi:hypothetical protein